MTRKMDTLHEDVCLFIISQWILFRVFQTKVVEKIETSKKLSCQQMHYLLKT
jgi:hypothetical protein